MSKELCILTIKNKKHAIRTIARSILQPKQIAAVRFYTVGQLETALAIERAKGIDILTPIPENVASKLKSFSKNDESKKDETPAKKEGLTSVGETLDEAPVKEENSAPLNEVSNEDTIPNETSIESEGMIAPTLKIDAPLTRDEILKMSKGDILKHAEEHDIDHTGLNGRSKAKEVIDFLLGHYGYELSPEE